MTEAKNILLIGINHKFLAHDGQLGLKDEVFPESGPMLTACTTRPDLVICVDVSRSALRKVKRWHKIGVRTVLIASEPKVVIPANYSKKTVANFDRIIEIGRPKSNPLLPWPQHQFSNPVNSPRPNSAKAILIQSRKYSFVKGQLYGLRVELAAKDSRVHVVGYAWDESVIRTVGRLVIELGRAISAGASIDLRTFVTAFQKPINNLGPVDSKIVAMNNFKVAVVIENSQEYMSEKLFDALVGGCIPVYVGPDLADFDIPSGLYVKADATLESVRLAISKALNLDYGKWQSQVGQFLSLDATRKRWEYSSAIRRICMASREDLN